MNTILEPRSAPMPGEVLRCAECEARARSLRGVHAFFIGLFIGAAVASSVALIAWSYCNP